MNKVLHLTLDFALFCVFFGIAAMVCNYLVATSFTSMMIGGATMVLFEVVSVNLFKGNQ